MKFTRYPLQATDYDTSESLEPIHSPSGSQAIFLSWLAGFTLLTSLIIILSVHSLAANVDLPAAGNQPPLSWPLVLLVLIASVPLHEAVHLIWQPGYGLTDRSIVLVQPEKLKFGVYFDGCMARRRWLIMRLAPLFFLVICPGFILGAGQYVPLAHYFSLSLQIFVIVNALGSGADLLAAGYVLAQVPAGSSICFEGGKAYWRITTN